MQPTSVIYSATTCVTLVTLSETVLIAIAVAKTQGCVANVVEESWAFACFFVGTLMNCNSNEAVCSSSGRAICLGIEVSIVTRLRRHCVALTNCN